MRRKWQLSSREGTSSAELRGRHIPVLLSKPQGGKCWEQGEGGRSHHGHALEGLIGCS